jgi:hypothetical protein
VTLLVTAAALAAATAGCGSDESGRLPSACADSVTRVRDALAKAPGAVALDGVPLSTCVQRARTGAEIQTIGVLFTATADALAARARDSDAAALQLGYLLGATRRGASRTSGLHAELIRRLENSSGLDGMAAARRAAFRRGVAAGGAGG